jgi:hypothetical protein
LDRNNFDVGGDVVFAAKVEHLLSHGYPANSGTGKIAVPKNQVESSDSERLRRSTDEGQVAITSEQFEIRVDVVIGRDGVENEIEAIFVLLHLIGVAGHDDFIGA